MAEYSGIAVKRETTKADYDRFRGDLPHDLFVRALLFLWLSSSLEDRGYALLQAQRGDPVPVVGTGKGDQ